MWGTVSPSPYLHFRLVWNRIWAVLSDFFVNVCCHQNLNIAIYAVDSLRQLAMKFLERDELANYSFQNDFMKPFVIVMRQSKAVEIRELIIRFDRQHFTLPRSHFCIDQLGSYAHKSNLTESLPVVAMLQCSSARMMRCGLQSQCHG